MLRLGHCKPGSWGSFWAILTLVGLVARAAQRADLSGEATGTSINHSQVLLHRLQELLRQGNASDVVLRVQAAGTDEVRVFHAHRLLLGLHSDLFRELLSNQSEVMLQEPRDCAAVFDKFQGRLVVRHAYSFHQSSEEAGDFLAHADLQRRNSEYLVENALHLHLIVKPVYHTLIRTPE
ncbi:BTB/POZ domain-containing protein 17 [Carlito syrichta]|uniref:BTB/POZ domain-containing protein 17 n=1 Tax=Carlito syrichta TaxID=1868482 RepID=A0A3Q0EFX7_CARSF|nr:BTB/POZ domain-containing protein 17 [Carlito syrichta]